MAGERVLVVDDNPTNLKLARVLLQANQYDVRTADDAQQALSILQTFLPQLILLDLQMPGMDGLELTRRLKAQDATRGIIVLAFTAFAMKGDEEKALAAGCDGFITKPIDTRTLSSVLREFLSGARGPEKDARA